MGRAARAVVASLVAIGAIWGEAQALDPRHAISQYVYKSWQHDSGLPGPAVLSVAQTRDGYLWLGTSSGLVRFDGARFFVFDASQIPGFGDGGVSRLAEARDGSLFCGTTAGTVLQFRDGAFTRLFVASGTAYVSSLLAVRDGSLWIGLYGQPAQRWLKGQITALRSAIGTQAAFAMAEDAQGGIWIGTHEKGLLRYADGQFRPQSATGDTIQALCFDRRGALWIGTPHGLLRLRAGRTERFTEKNGLSANNVSAILEDRDGNLWVGTAGGGLNRLTTGRWTSLTASQGLSDDDVRCLREDREGNLWVGTADGLTRLSTGRFITYGRREGLHDPAVTSVAEGSGGTVWAGTNSGLIVRLRRGVIESFELPASVGREAVLALREMRDGSLWVALDNARIFRLKDGRISEHTPVEAAKDSKIRNFSEDEDGPIFMVTTAGPARLRDRRIVPVYPGVLGLRYPHATYWDAQGALWIGDLRGLARIAGGQVKLFTTRDGLPSNRVRWVAGEKDGGLWAATIGGLAYLKDGRIHTAGVDQGLPESYLRLVLDDNLGHLWVAAMGHIFRLDKAELLDLFSGRIRRVAPVAFDTSDGLRTTETLLSNNPGFRARDGRLWFATAKGVSVVDPAHMAGSDPAPQVTIESITVDGRSRPSTGGEAGPPDRAPQGIEYPPGRGDVTIEYTALSLSFPTKMRFRYRLEGYDHDWVVAGERRVAYYTNLSANRYRFTVTACNRDGAWNGPLTGLDFAIRPPFHRTPLFYVLCVAALIGLVASAHRLRVGQVHSRLAAIIGERTRIARELHDTLAQGLAGVAIQIETATESLAEGTQVARQHLAQVDAMVRSSLAEVRRSIWVLRAQTSKGREGLAATLSDSLAQLTEETQIASSIEITGQPRELASEVELNLLRIAHEAVTNAVRHAKAKQITIRLHFDLHGLRLRVKDDGCGFDADQAVKRPGLHFGLRGISERVRALGGELHLDTRPGQGAEIVCYLPYHCQVDPTDPAIAGGEGGSR